MSSVASTPPETEAVASVAADAWRLMFELAMRHRATMLAVAAKHELSPPQLFMLRRLEPGQPTPMSELAAFMGCDASNITGLVDRLEARGLVERRVPLHDRRVKQIVLTAAGERLRDEALQHLHTAPDELTSLSGADQRALRDILRRALGQA
jgi:MarR family transcriptional regulator, organic hydroperoxide resistance regulator